MADAMSTRERFAAVMAFQPVDRLPVVEWAAWWDQTLDAWCARGLPPALRDRYALYDHLGLECYWQDWIAPRRPTCPQPRAHGAGLIAPTMDAYTALRPHLYPPPEQALDPQRWAPWIARQQRGDAVLWFTVLGFFWFPRTLLGVEEHFFALVDAPELIHRINRDLCDWTLALLAHLRRFAKPDFMTFAEDLSYNHGPMLSPAMFEAFLAPYYREIIPTLQEMGVRIFIDSDGDVSAPARWYAALGVDGMLPLERQAGVDAAAIRAELPAMRFIGHFDKLTMHRGEAAMRAEFERLLPLMRRGGFIPSVDHQTPPAVTLDDYRTYLRLLHTFARAAAE